MPSEVKTPGGLSFDLEWKEPDQEAAKKRPLSPPSNKGTPTLGHIKEKLTKAEERRRSLEVQRLENIAKHNTDIIKEKQTKVQEINEAFQKEAELELQKKMSKAEEIQKANKLMREQKLKEAAEHLQKVRERKKEMSANGDSSPTNE